MSEAFRQKLKDYADGKLSDKERLEVEQELQKLEVYQAYLDEIMDRDPHHEPVPSPPSKKEKRIVRRGKWKARVSNTLTVISALLIITVISSILTALFFAMGTPSRDTKYRDAVHSAISISQPNVEVALNGQGKPFFMMEMYGDMQKKVGQDRVKAGTYSVNFFFGLPSVTSEWNNHQGRAATVFYRPEGASGASSEHGGDWSRLEKLPEGTVAEATVSFSRYFATDDILKQFEGLNMEPVWFAVDTGPDERFGDRDQVISDPVGFPAYPVWHHDDLTVTHYEEQKTGWFGKTVSSGGHYPALETYRDGDIRNQHFIKSLRLLQEYTLIAKRVAPFIDIDASLDYIDQNGIRIYGAVITGPVKELLALREASWISNLRVGEVQLWNWSDR
ncbi:anti-sigma factor [Paenibacillus sp. JCM 10914]|uniref:anti-sigma factor n=1 Tax=Paenibacillus sp. JCM 10914 TaxID=1236974 RepID=UPI0003CC32E9|nr:anti-sigma factor [Paenibacillus sp. JCM 10914]GAE08966.1 sigma-M negative effector [Paenibacillus sp. JCM 10914]